MTCYFPVSLTKISSPVVSCMWFWLYILSSYHWVPFLALELSQSSMTWGRKVILLYTSLWNGQSKGIHPVRLSVCSSLAPSEHRVAFVVLGVVLLARPVWFLLLMCQSVAEVWEVLKKHTLSSGPVLHIKWIKVLQMIGVVCIKFNFMWKRAVET